MLDRLVVPPGVEVTLRVSAATGEATALWDPDGGRGRGTPAARRDRPGGGTHGGRRRPSLARLCRVVLPERSCCCRAARRATWSVARPSCATPRGCSTPTPASACSRSRRRRPRRTSSPSRARDRQSPIAPPTCTTVGLAVERRQVGEWRPKAGETFDVVIADPARTGLGKPGVARRGRGRRPGAGARQLRPRRPRPRRDPAATARLSPRVDRRDRPLPGHPPRRGGDAVHAARSSAGRLNACCIPCSPTTSRARSPMDVRSWRWSRRSSPTSACPRPPTRRRSTAA